MPSSFQASHVTHMPNNQCIMVRGETHLPGQKSLAITALRNVKFFHHPGSSCSPALIRQGQTEKALSAHQENKAGAWQHWCRLIYPEPPEGESFCHLSNSTAKEALPHQSPENALKMKSATYLLSILISREAAPFLTTKMIHTQNSFILKEAISFQK